jgi:hypothetical protein
MSPMSAIVDLYRFMALSMTEDAKESHAAWRERRAAEGPWRVIRLAWASARA